MTTKNTNGFRNKLFIILILTLFLILLPAAVYAESDPETSGDVAADDSSATSDAPDASAATEPSESSSSSSSETTPDSSATETNSLDSETASTESTDSQTPPEQPSEDLSADGDSDSETSDISNDPVEENEMLSEESLEPAELTTGEETEEPDSSDLSGDGEGDQAAEGNSYVATITPDASIDGSGSYTDGQGNPIPTTGESTDFTVTFTEVGDKAIGSAQVKMPDDNGNGSEDDGFRDFAFDPSTIQTSSGQTWDGELVSGCGLYYLNLWALSADDYLHNGESVSATFTATTPNDDNRGVYQFETKAWTDAATDFDGVGTAVNNMAVGYSDPVVIVGNPVSSPAELAAVTLNDHYVQVADIDLSSVNNWQPVGSSSCEHFIGSYNGNGYSIDNLKISQASSERGLFGVTEDATIINVKLENVNVSGQYNTGGLIGHMIGGMVHNSSASGTISSSFYKIGGLVGYNNGGILSGCSADVTVSGNYDVGGLVGYNDSTSLVGGSIATGNVTGVGFAYYIGGLVGHNKGEIVRCYASGDVLGERFVGGLVGYQGGDVLWSVAGSIYDSYAEGSVTGTNNIGGLAGYNSHKIVRSYATGIVDGDEYSGGLVGVNGNSSSITDCYSIGKVTGDEYVGGLIGLNYGQISDSYATGNVAGEKTVGGLVGKNEGVINDSFAANNVTGSLYVGGLAGWNADGFLNGCFAVQEPLVETGDPEDTALTTKSAMKQLATYENAGWSISLLSDYDPENPATFTWYIDEGHTYPLLWWQDMPELVQTPNILVVGNYYFDFPGLVFAQPSTAGRSGVIYGSSSLITPWFVQTSSAEKLAAALEAYEQLLQAFEANKDNLSDREYARQQVELAVALAAIRALEASIAASAGQDYDLTALVSAYQTALNLVETHANHLTGYQHAYALLVLSTVAEIINNLGGSVN